jgi:hypothetical protein
MRTTSHKVSHETGVEKTSTIVAAIGQGWEGSPRGVSKVIPMHVVASFGTG